MAKYSHLNSEDRSHIETGLNNRQSFKEIGEKIGKDCSTISKEIRPHMVFRKTGAYGRPFNDCVRRKTCQFSGVCDVKCIYDAAAVQAEYSEVLSETRQGFAVSDEEKKRLDDIISPLIRKGQSLHHICLNHMDELMVTERTLYTYMDAGLFTARNIDMPRKVRMKPRRKRPDTIKVDPKCREGRTLQDYEKYRNEHPDTPMTQLDSVEGVKGSAVMLTVTFPSTGLQLAFRRNHNDAQSVIDIFNRFYSELGPDTFIALFPVLLADNGSEFSDPKNIEFDAKGNRRSRMFYCNASAPYQKGYDKKSVM